MEAITLITPDVSCEHCQRAIEGTLGKLDGIGQVRVDIPSKAVHVSYDHQKLTQGRIVEVLDDLGYTVAHSS